MLYTAKQSRTTLIYGNQMHRFTRKRGFHLLDMLMVLALLAIIAAIAAPSWQGLLVQFQARHFMQQLQQQLWHSRLLAIARQQPVQLCPWAAQQCQTDWQKWPRAQLLVTLPASPQSPAEQLHLRYQSPPPQHQLSYNHAAIRFRKDGSLDALQSGSFIYCVPDMPWHFRLSISQAGRSQLQSITQPCPRA